MPKHPLSVTLEADNITWLKGRVGATGKRSISELIDTLVTEARAGRAVSAPRSVVGTIDVDPNDPLLEHADELIEMEFARSLSRPTMVRERPPAYGRASKSRKARRG